MTTPDPSVEDGALVVWSLTCGHRTAAPRLAVGSTVACIPCSDVAGSAVARDVAEDSGDRAPL